jgi:hypothetical protein
MRNTVPKSNPSLGFLTVVEHPEHGLFGGYLLLNQAGRPLEFHCTAPIKPNRAQQILYGPTLEPYLFGEQIGQTLLAKSKIEPVVVCTDREAALAVRAFVSIPVALVLERENKAVAQELPVKEPLHDATGRTFRVDAAHATHPPHGRAFVVGDNRLAVSQQTPDDQEQVAQRLAELPETFDLMEPFQRIREAIEEAQRGS